MHWNHLWCVSFILITTKSVRIRMVNGILMNKNTHTHTQRPMIMVSRFSHIVFTIILVIVCGHRYIIGFWIIFICISCTRIFYTDKFSMLILINFIRARVCAMYTNLVIVKRPKLDYCFYLFDQIRQLREWPTQIFSLLGYYWHRTSQNHFHRQFRNSYLFLLFISNKRIQFPWAIPWMTFTQSQ